MIKTAISVLFLFWFSHCDENPTEDEVIIMPFETVVILGRTIFLSCHIKTPIKNCTWEINGVIKNQEPVIEHKKFRSEFFSKCILEIEALTGYDIGQWTCYLTDNEGNEKRKSITLSLKPPYGLYAVLFIGLFIISGYVIGYLFQKKCEGTKWKPGASEIQLSHHSETPAKVVYGRHQSLTFTSSNKSLPSTSSPKTFK